jgi:DNA-binding transcriptional LysR family regulator
MDIEQARTFLTIAACGSFLEASQRLHVTQSTVSARIQKLESELNALLFQRGRAGAKLTPAGKRFLEHAKRLVLTAQQARDEVGLPGRFRASLRIGARIALWEDLLPEWVNWLRSALTDVALRCEIGFEEDLMRRLIEGTLDVGIMYSPNQSPGLVVEQLFDEQLVLVATRPAARPLDDDYVYVEWGPGFYAQHAQHYPGLERPAQVVNIGWLGVQLILHNGGSCFLPLRMAQPLLDEGRLYRVKDSPVFAHPVYAVYPRISENIVLDKAIEGLRAKTRKYR